MKKLITLLIVSALLFLNSSSFAQWQTQGPDGGPSFSLASSGSTLFIGTDNGVFKSTDYGTSWSAANNGIQRDAISSLAVNGSNIFAGTANDGIYFSSNNGVSWAPRMNGVTSPFISTVFTSSAGVFAGTSDGAFFSSDNGMSWTLRNSGIPNSYVIYSWTQIGDTIYGGLYGEGLYQTSNNGMSWTITDGGFPSGTFVYALITVGNSIIAGTSAGIYKSSDRGKNWSSSNTGFPAGMWAKSFAAKPGYIFAGTYSEGIYVSTNGGNSWAPANSGIPDFPFQNGLPHNYPSTEALIISGTGIIAATDDAAYKSINNGSSWSESVQGMISTNIMDVTTMGTNVFAASSRTGVYASNDNGGNWHRTNNNLRSHDMTAVLARGSSIFAATNYDGVYRSDDLGMTWNNADTGIPSQVFEFGQDAGRVLALTNGTIGTPPGLYQTVNNGTSWTEIPTGFTSLMSCFTNTSTDIYIGTWEGKVMYSNTNGSSWQDKSAGLPNVKITSILISGSVLLLGTEGSGVYKSTDYGSTWHLSTTGLNNNYIMDLNQSGGVIYAASWGNGVFVSSNSGASWTAYNSGLANMYVRKITMGNGKAFAGTEAGVYSAPLAAVGIAETSLENSLNIYPNPGSGVLHCEIPANQKINLSINSIDGNEVYHYEGYSESIMNIDLSDKAKGLYFIHIGTDNGNIKRKTVLQ
jgi:photosystem II stability/assembly factor-like uncharacterized protein